MDDDYKKEIDEIYKRLSAKNQEKLADLLAKQEEDEEELRETTKNLPNKVNSAKCWLILFYFFDKLGQFKLCGRIS